MTPLRLLVLAAGTRVGQNILATFAGRRDHVRLVATTSVPDEPGPFGYDTVHLVPETRSSDYEAKLLDIVASERIDLVVPCRDDDVLMLAGLRERRPDLAAGLLCGSVEAARAICDKAEGFAFSILAQVLTLSVLPLAGLQLAPAGGWATLPLAAFYAGAASASLPI